MNVSKQKIEDIVNILESYRIGFVQNGNLACNKMLEILDSREKIADAGTFYLNNEKIAEVKGIYIRERS